MKFVKYLLLLGLYIGLNPTAKAQKLILSDKVDLSIRNDDFAIVGKWDKQYVVYRRHNEMPELIFYNSDLIKIKSLPLDFIPSRFTSLFAEVVSDGILICYQIKEEKQKKMMVVKLNEQFQVSAPKVIMDIADATTSNMENAILVSSENKKFHLLFSNGWQQGSILVKAKVFDADLNLITNITQQVTNEKNWSVQNIACVSNEGDFVMLMNEKLSTKGATDELKVLMARSGANQLGIFPVALNKHAVIDMQVMCDNKHNLFYLGGLYADGRYNSPRGLFFTTFDPLLQASTTSHFTSVQSQLNGSDLRDYRVRNMIIKDDGGVEFVTEKYFQNIRTLTSMNPTMSIGVMSIPDQTRTINEYYYDEVVLFSLKPDGSLGWSQTLLKQQQTSDDAGIYSSFGILNYRLGRVYIFGDINTKQPRLMACYIANNSEMNIKELYTTSEMNEWNWMPRSLKQISKAEILMPCLSKNYLCFLKISY